MTDRDPFGRYRERMAALGFRPRRRFGQNFLLDPSLHRALVAEAAVDRRDLVLEVGPGLGFLTRELAAHAKRVVAVEIDPRLARLLEEDLAEHPDRARVHLMIGDALADGRWSPSVVQAWRAVQPDPGGRRLLVANLPYAISGPLLADAPLQEPPVDEAVVLVQEELAARIAAGAGTPDYGSLSALLQAFYRPRLVRRVGREVFRPRPNVDSAVLRLQARPGPFAGLLPTERREFAAFVRALFQSRRKKVRGSLARLGRDAAGLPASLLEARPDALTPEGLFTLWVGGANCP